VQCATSGSIRRCTIRSDDRTAGRREPAGEIDAGLELADRAAALRGRDRLDVAGEVVGEQVGRREGRDAAIGELVEALEPAGDVVGREPGAEDVAALDGVHDRGPPARQDGVELGVRARELEAVAAARDLALHVGHLHEQASPRVLVQEGATAVGEVRGEPDQRAAEERRLRDVERRPQDLDAAAPEHLEVAQARQRVERLAGEVVAAQVAVPEERVHRRVRVDVGESRKRAAVVLEHDLGRCDGVGHAPTLTGRTSRAGDRSHSPACLARTPGALSAVRLGSKP
jgi:hypothetical protein